MLTTFVPYEVYDYGVVAINNSNVLRKHPQEDKAAITWGRSIVGSLPVSFIFLHQLFNTHRLKIDRRRPGQHFSVTVKSSAMTRAVP